MKMTKSNLLYLITIGFLLFAATFRIANASQLDGIPNFSPIGAMALFGGAYFSNRWKAFLFPLLTLLLSDLIINQVVFKGQYGLFHNTWYITYGVFAVIVILGSVLLKNVTVVSVIGASLASTLVYWGIVDFSYWAVASPENINVLTNQPLSRDFSGLMQAYIQGIPFIKNFAIGTTLFSILMFGGIEFLKSYLLEKELVKEKI